MDDINPLPMDDINPPLDVNPPHFRHDSHLPCAPFLNGDHSVLHATAGGDGGRGGGDPHRRKGAHIGSAVGSGVGPGTKGGGDVGGGEIGEVGRDVFDVFGSDATRAKEKDIVRGVGRPVRRADPKTEGAAYGVSGNSVILVE